MTEISTTTFIFVYFQFVKMYDFRLFGCCFFVGSDIPEGQLMNSQVPATAIYACIYVILYHSGKNACTHSRFIHQSTNENMCWTAAFSMQASGGSLYI